MITLDFSQWAALWYIGGMISGALVMLALLDGACPSHPRLECLFTTDEEVGLGGAKAFDFSPVTAKKLINLDSEEENCVLVSCAGGMRIDILSRY